MNIVVTKDFGASPEQRKRLDSLGNVTYYDTDYRSPDEWYQRVQGADIICSGRLGLDSDKAYLLQDVLIVLPIVGYDFLDLDRLRANNVAVANAPGCNKEAVVEWIVGMLLMQFRNLHKTIQPADLTRSDLLQTGQSLWGKQVTVLGAGNIGQHLAQILIAFGATPRLFRRGDDLHESVKDADIIVNCLTANESTTGLLDADFFQQVKTGAYFVSVARPQIYDVDAMLVALDEGRLAGVLDDAGGANIADVQDEVYQKLYAHPKVLVTPHLAWNSESEVQKSNDLMIDAVEAWVKGERLNVVT